MSAFIPDQLEQMSKKDLLEFSQTAHEENVKLVQQLQESEQVRTEYSFLIADLVRRADIKDDLYKNPTHQKASEQLNKFAIEKKIEGAQRVLDCGELNLSQGDIDTIRLIQEQLRKEQDK